MIKTLFVYIVKCSDFSYYIGVTNNIERRVWEHNNDHSPISYTYKRRPVQLVFSEEFEDYYAALEFEKRIKGWSRKKKEALISREWGRLPELSRCLNTTSHTNKNKNSRGG